MSNASHKWQIRSYYSGILLSGLFLIAYFTFLFLFDTDINLFVSDSFLSSSWILELLPIPLFISGVLSSNTYIGKTLDYQVNKQDKKNRYERWGTYFGLTVAFVLGAVFSSFISLAVSPVKIAIQAVNMGFFMLNCVGSMTGLFSRLGGIKDKNERSSTEKKITFAGFLFGIGLASVAVATSALTGGALIPVWGAFLLTIASNTSAFDSVSKAFTVVKPSKSDKQFKTLEKKTYEYQGALIGVLVGVLLAAAVAAFLIATHGIGIIAVLALFSSSMSGMGGLFSRGGKFIDMIKAKNKPKSEPRPENLKSSYSPKLLSKTLKPNSEAAAKKAELKGQVHQFVTGKEPIDEVAPEVGEIIPRSHLLPEAKQDFQVETEEARVISPTSSPLPKAKLDSIAQNPGQISEVKQEDQSSENSYSFFQPKKDSEEAEIQKVIQNYTKVS